MSNLPIQIKSNLYKLTNKLLKQWRHPARKELHPKFNPIKIKSNHIVVNLQKLMR